MSREHWAAGSTGKVCLPDPFKLRRLPSNGFASEGQPGGQDLTMSLASLLMPSLITAICLVDEFGSFFRASLGTKGTHSRQWASVASVMVTYAAWALSGRWTLAGSLRRCFSFLLCRGVCLAESSILRTMQYLYMQL